MFGISFSELLIIVGVGLIVLGPKRIPELAQFIGKISREVRRARLQVMDALDGHWNGQSPSMTSIVPNAAKHRRLPADSSAGTSRQDVVGQADETQN